MTDMKRVWEESFEEQIASGAYNTSPVEAVIRSVAYWLRDQPKRPLHFLDMGCGAGPTMVWLAQKGMTVSGIDIAANALTLARKNLERNGCSDRLGQLVEGSVVKTPFADESFDGIVEANVFQHIPRAERVQAFREVGRLLKPGGLFVGYMLADAHTTFQKLQANQLPEDPGSLHLEDGGSKFYLTNIGLAHFFKKDEYTELFKGFSVVDPCLVTYYLPKSEAKKRGYDEYLTALWTVVAVK